MPHSLFHFDSSPSFSLPAGMDMNQAAIMNSMMQPVPIFGQQSFSAFEPDTQINDSISRQTRQTRRSNQRFDDEPASRILDFGQSVLDLAAREISAPADRVRDPIRATYQLGPDYDYETVMERESGEVFVPSASQLDSFMDGMEASSQPTATGLGLGGSEGVVFGGGRAPMGQDETRARIAELFGLDAPATLNQAMLNDLDAVMGTDAQGRMRSFESPKALQQNLANAQSAFDLASLDRLARLEQRDLRPGETQTERDTRIADSRTEGADRGREMTFEEARKFVPRGQREKVKAYNERIRAFQAQQNSTINELKEESERYRVAGRRINNERLQAYLANYQQTEPQKLKEVVDVARSMLNTEINGKFILEDETQAAMYIIQQMGGKVSDIFETGTPSGSTSPMIDQIRQAGQQGDSSSQKSLDDQAYEYAINNPNDPRSQQILDRLGRK